MSATDIATIIHRVASFDEAYTITRAGEDAAVILGSERYESMVETLNILSDPDTMAAINEACAE